MYLYLILAIIFIFGLCVGSFLNVLVYRLEDKKRKNMLGRSFCPNCERSIKWFDMFPVLSWFLLGGKCRNCKKEISAQYPLVEFATGAMFATLGYFIIFSNELNFLSLISLVFWIIFAFCLIAIFVYDAKHQIIPDEIIYTALVVGFLYVVLNSLLLGDYKYLVDHLASGLLAGGFFYALAAVSKGKWMGGGDIKLVAFMGLVLGWQGTIIALYTAFVLGALVGGAALATKKKKIGSKIPFGPFLVIGAFAGFLFGGYLISFYVNMFM